MFIPACEFCREFSGKPGSVFERIYGEERQNRVLFRSHSFVIAPSLGQIVEGYLLIMPHEHWTTIADLPDTLVHELRALCKIVRTELKSEYGSSMIFYEHGARSEDVGGCGIYHAHLHAVPWPTTLDQIESLKSRFPYREIGSVSEIRKSAERMSTYLFYESPQGRAYVFDTGSLPSQYMRKLLAEALGTAEWDWRSSGREERVLNTLKRLSHRFDAARTSLEFQRVIHGTPR